MIDQFSFANPRADGKKVAEAVGEEDLEIGTVIPRASFDYSSSPSPLLWKNMNFPTSQSASSSPMHYTSSRAQEIARYRKEMMDLVRGMPESAYELSLRDMVETPGLVKKLEEAAETRQEGAKNKAEKATDKSKGARRLQKNETMETGFFLKTFVPVLDGGKTKSSRSNYFAKVSPKPEAEKGLHGSIEGQWWNKNELRDRGSSSETSSRSTSRSSSR